MQTTVSRALLIAVFRAARGGRRPNLTVFCKRARITAAELQAAFDELEQRGLLSFSSSGERLTLQGLALAAALSTRASRRHRPLVSCRPLAA